MLAAVVIGAVIVAAIGSGGHAGLDADSADGGGSRALARVLAGYGVRLEPTASVTTAVGVDGSVVVLDPDAYSAAQLRRLADDAARVVLVRPTTRSLRAVSAVLDVEGDDDVDAAPDCTDDVAAAGGDVAWPDDARAYTGSSTSCYGGAVVSSGRIVVLGSVDVLTNDRFGDEGVAALDVNVLSDGRADRTVAWLRPGSDADGSGAVSVWDLFPGWTYRAFVWLLAVGLLVVLWRARRLGPPVAEPLPVVVRAAELVEGHGRLYRRAAARGRAAQALREATVERLRIAGRLPAGSSSMQVGAVVGPVIARSPAELHELLAGPVPSDDAALISLALELAALETAVREGFQR